MSAPTPNRVPDGQLTGDDALRAMTSALDNARNMTLASQQFRTQNFNFFVIVTAALVTGYAKLNQHWQLVFGIAGMIISAMFLVLDVRGRGLYKRSVDQMAFIEPQLWERAHLDLKCYTPPLRAQGPQFFISHGFIYRTFFIMVGVAWLGSLIFKPLI